MVQIGPKHIAAIALAMTVLLGVYTLDQGLPTGAPSQPRAVDPAYASSAANRTHLEHGLSRQAVPGRPDPGTGMASPQRRAGHESVDDIIERIKRDVIVTGSVMGASTSQSAFFRIEGLPDREFSVGQQLMDGFVIIEITHHEVVLKNQVGPETFSLYY